MMAIKTPNGFLALLALAFFCGRGIPAWGQSLQAYYDYLASAQSAWSEASQLCQATECGADLSDKLAAWQNGISNLSQLLSESPPRRAAIHAAIASLSPTAQEICNRLDGQCPAAPAGFGASDGNEGDVQTAGSVAPSETPGGVSCIGCWEQQWTCQSAHRVADPVLYACQQRVNRLFNCWQRVPFADWPGLPFDAAAYARDCGEFVSEGVLPWTRCPCPQSERQGGCPDFFQTGGGCRECSYSSCERGRSGDSRCSCAQNGPPGARQNLVQCDLCRWNNVGKAVTELRRQTFCLEPYLTFIRSFCIPLDDRCARCPPPPPNLY